VKKFYVQMLHLRRQHFETRRVAKALLVAVPTIAIGNWLLQFDVSRLGLDPVWAYRANWPIITLLCFILNRVFTWGDRKNASKLKWVLISALHSAVSQAIYPRLVHAGVNYLLASVALLALSPIIFVLNNLITFRKEKQTDKA